nr:MAG TPA: hypothetical protein [Caudoviricetes sp.]
MLPRCSKGSCLLPYILTFTLVKEETISHSYLYKNLPISL